MPGCFRNPAADPPPPCRQRILRTLGSAVGGSTVRLGASVGVAVVGASMGEPVVGVSVGVVGGGASVGVAVVGSAVTAPSHSKNAWTAGSVNSRS